MNLEPSPSLAREKLDYEMDRVFSVLQVEPGTKVVDLGGGVGFWAKRFEDFGAEVVLVERELSFVESARDILADTSIEIIHLDCVDFDADEQSIDMIFLSGVSIYLDDSQLEMLLKRAAKYVREGGVFIHRDAYGVDKHFEFQDRFSENLQELYSASYRTRDRYDEIFSSAGWSQKTADFDMYEGSVKKRWSETDLRVALYQR
jgi:SAM-dependent methyltransferase